MNAHQRLARNSRSSERLDSWRRHYLPRLLIAVLLLAAGRAEGVERYQAVVLPDAGFGGEPLSISQSITRPITTAVVGRIELADGRRVPVVWEVESDGNATVHPLPIPAGASGAAFDEQPLDELLAIVGTVTPAEGPSFAVLWLGGVADGFTVLPLPDLGLGSRANGLALKPGLSKAEVVGSAILDSEYFCPQVWSIDFETGEITTECLPLPPETEGTANSITCAAHGDLVAVGTVSREGRMRAAQWTHEGEGWTGGFLDTPRRADSTAIFTDGFESGDLSAVATVGAVCFDGLCIATLWGPGGVPANLPANPAFVDSIANGFWIDLGAAFAAVGRMSDAAGDVGTLFLPQVDLAANINQLLVNPDEALVTEVNAIGPGGVMVGTGVADSGKSVSSCNIVLLPVGSLVAQQIGVPVGKVNGGDVTSTWRDDNDRLRLKPGGAQGGRTIVVEFGSQAIGQLDLPELCVCLLGNGRAKDETSTFDVRVQLFNFQTRDWETAGRIEMTTTENESFFCPARRTAKPYVDETQKTRIRLQIRRTAGRGRWEFEVNRVTTTTPGFET